MNEEDFLRLYEKICQIENMIKELKIQTEQKYDRPEAPTEYFAVEWEEYKELLTIKGKYEELSKLHTPVTLNYNGFNEKGTTIIPCKEIQTNDPLVVPPYKITC